MTYPCRRASVVLAFVLSSIAAACSGLSSGGGSGVGTSGQGESSFDVRITGSIVTIENHAGGPLLDVDVTIKPVGGIMSFTKSVSRMETSEKRDLFVTDFRSRDGTTFNLRMMRPKEILVTANDLNGRKHEQTVAWK
jgi:hypothetical protein